MHRVMIKPGKRVLRNGSSPFEAGQRRILHFAAVIPAVIILSLAFCFTWLISCGRTRPPAKRPNVIFVLADTLRADHLGSYGYPRQTSPFLDQLARSSVQFLNVRSQAACTFPSVNSLLTSKNIFTFHQPETRPGIPEDVTALPEILKQHGYQTFAVSASPIVRKTPSKFNPVGGFGRGFDNFDEQCLWRPSRCVSQAAIQHLDGPALVAPFFLYLHYMDPHDPYAAMREHRGRFASPYEGPHPFIASGKPNEIRHLIRRGLTDQLPNEADFKHLVDLYDEEIYSLDFGLQWLFEGLDQRGLLEETVVVVASDHGEAFHEHGHVKHCNSVYDNETRVPLLLHLPGQAPVQRTSWVQNLDIVPTLLDYLRIDAGAYGLEGRSLLQVIESAEAPTYPAFSAMGPQRSVNDDRYKLVLDFKVKSFALYDLTEDPGETRDLSSQHPEICRRLLRELRSWIQRFDPGPDDQRLHRARELEAELEALGYL